MSKIKLTGSNSGYVEISSAADAGNLTLQLPTAGTALLSNAGNVFSGITTTGQLDINGSIDVSSTSVFNDDLTLTGASYNVVWDKSDNQLEFGDNAKISFGGQADMRLFHDGTNSVITNATGDLYINNNADTIIKPANDCFIKPQDGENGISVIGNGAVELYFNNSKKIETTNTGAVVTGICTATSFSGSGEGLTRTTQLSHRNKFINGAMRFSQRATSFNSTLSSDQYILDRFKHIIRGTNDSYYYQVIDHPEGFGNSMKVTCNSTYTPSGSDNAGFQSFLEGQDLQDLNFGTSNAKSFTVSFYAKSASQNNGHQYTFQIRSYPTSGDTRIKNFPFTVTTSWQRFTFTFTGDTGNDIANTNGAGFACLWNLNAGPDDITSQYTNWTSLNKFMCVTGQSNFLDNTNNEFYLTGVQLEVGSQATPFEHRSFGEELQRCQRYFAIFPGRSGGIPFWQAYMGASFGYCSIPVPINMRAVPTPTDATTGTSSSTGNLYNATGGNINSRFAGNGTVTLSCGGYAPSGLAVIMNFGTHQSGNKDGVVASWNGASPGIFLDAEL